MKPAHDYAQLLRALVRAIELHPPVTPLPMQLAHALANAKEALADKDDPNL